MNRIALLVVSDPQANGRGIDTGAWSDDELTVATCSPALLAQVPRDSVECVIVVQGGDDAAVVAGVDFAAGSMPVLAVSSNRGTEERIRLFGLGVDGVLDEVELDASRVREAAWNAVFRHRQRGLLVDTLVAHLELLAVPMYLCASSGEFTFANGALARLLGYPDSASLMAVGAAALWTEATERQEWLALATEDGVIRQERSVRHAGGRVIWVQESASLIAAANGETLIEGSLRDITANRRTLLEVEDGYLRFAQFFDRAPIALFLEDFSALHAWVEHLRVQGVTDIRSFLEADSETVRFAVGLVRIVKANAAAARMVAAVSPDDMIGSVPTAIIGDDLGVWIDQIVGVWDGSTTLTTSGTGSDLAGKANSFELTWVLAPGIGADLSRVIVAMRDTTEQFAAEAVLRDSEARRRRVFESVPVAVLEIDVSRLELGARWTGEIEAITKAVVVTDANAAARTLLGDPKAVDDTHRPVSPGAQGLELLAGICRAIASGNGSLRMGEADLEVLDRDWHVSWTAPAIEDRSGMMRVIVALADTTQARDAARSLQSLVNAKDEFLAAVSHEIRTPLTAIIGFASELASGGVELSTATGLDYLKQIIAAADEGAAVVENMASVVEFKVRPGGLLLGVVDLAVEARTVLKAFSASDGRRLSLFAESTLAWGDALRVRQMIRNLVLNAVRHGGPSVSIVVSRDGDRALVEVSDDGPAIADETAAQMFSWYRSARATGVTQPLGMGLPVTASLASAMGGVLGYFRRDHRSVFAIKLPLASSMGDSAVRTGPVFPPARPGITVG